MILTAGEKTLPRFESPQPYNPPKMHAKDSHSINLCLNAIILPRKTTMLQRKKVLVLKIDARL